MGSKRRQAVQISLEEGLASTELLAGALRAAGRRVHQDDRGPARFEGDPPPSGTQLGLPLASPGPAKRARAPYKPIRLHRKTLPALWPVETSSRPGWRQPLPRQRDGVAAQCRIGKQGTLVQDWSPAVQP